MAHKRGCQIFYHVPPLAADSSSHFSDQLSCNLPQEKVAHIKGVWVKFKAMALNMKASIMYLDVGYKTVYSDLNYGKLTGSKEYLMKRRMLFIYTVSGTWADMSHTCPCLQLALIHIFKVHINTLVLRCQMSASAVFHCMIFQSLYNIKLVILMFYLMG